MKAAVVTGASSGIGEATARLLDREGYELLLVARRADRLEELARSLRSATPLALDLTEQNAPARVRAAVDELGRLDLLVNNAGSSRPAAFGDEDGGYDNVRGVMALNFDAVLRLTEALLPTLRRSAPSSVVNVSSIAGRVGRPRGGAYSASKWALAGWSECLYYDELEHGVHVGLVLPGFVATEGFPQSQLTGRRATRWMVSTPEKVADAIFAAGPGGRTEIAVPRPWTAVPIIRAIGPTLWRRLAGRMAG